MSEGTGTGPERRPGSAPRADAAQTPEAIEARLNAQREALSASVDELAARARAAGVPVVDGPRRTGDGYYEAVLLDPEGNRVEVVAGDYTDEVAERRSP